MVTCRSSEPKRSADTSEGKWEENKNWSRPVLLTVDGEFHVFFFFFFYKKALQRFGGNLSAVPARHHSHPASDSN